MCCTEEMVFQCKACSACFRKNMLYVNLLVCVCVCVCVCVRGVRACVRACVRLAGWLRRPDACAWCRRYFEEADEFCPHCGNRYVITAETPETQKEIDEAKAKAAAAAKAAKNALKPKPAGGVSDGPAGAGAGAGAGSGAPGRPK